MDVELTPYRKALETLARDKNSIAFQAIVDALNERLKEMDRLWLEEQEQIDFNVDRLRAKKQGTIELKKLLKDIGRAVQEFEAPAEGNGGGIPVLMMEKEYGPTD